MATIEIGKFMLATELVVRCKNKVFHINSAQTRDYLGVVCWHSHRRRYWFEPENLQKTVGFDATCLRDLANFIDLLMSGRKTETFTAKRTQPKGQK